VIVFTDTMPLTKKKRAMEKGVKSILKSLLDEGVTYQIYHHQSKSNFNLQVVDYCNWAIYRKWSRGDTRSYDIIKPCIDAEWDVYRNGTNTFY
jgi:hypothetical protein